jgi:hypothetical protein
LRNGTYLDVEEVFGEHCGTMINGDTRAVELTTQHFSGDRHAKHITRELDVGLQVVDVGGTLENLKKAGLD